MTAKHKLFARKGASLHDGHPEQIMLRDLEDLFECEVLRWLQLTTLAVPGHRGAVTSMRSELLQAVVDAVEKDLVVDVLVLRQLVAIDVVLAELFARNLIEIKTTIRVAGVDVPALLSSFLQFQVKIQGKDLGHIQMEMLIVADLVILHLLELVKGISSERFLELVHKVYLVGLDLFHDLVNVFFNRKQVSLYSFLLEELYLLNISLSRGIFPWNDIVDVPSHIL